MTLLLALAAALSQNSDPFARYADFTKAHPGLQVHVAATLNDHPSGVGTLRFQRPDQLLYRTRSENFDYSVSDTTRGYVEIENRTKEFDEFEFPGRMIIYDSEINPTASMLAPRFLLVENLKFVFRGKPQVTPSGSGDLIYEKDQGPSGVAETWATVDSEGKIVSARRKVVGREVIDITWQFSDYKFSESSGIDPFQTPVPAGYTQHSVPRMNVPLQIGSAAPVTGWTDGRTGKVVDLLEASGKKPFLIVYSSPDSEPGKRSLASIDRLKGKLPIFVIGDTVKDPDGSRVHALNPPGSPMFYLIDATGKVVKLWFGYDTARATEFEGDVLDSSKSG